VAFVVGAAPPRQRPAQCGALRFGWEVDFPEDRLTQLVKRRKRELGLGFHALGP